MRKALLVTFLFAVGLSPRPSSGTVAPSVPAPSTTVPDLPRPPPTAPDTVPEARQVLTASAPAISVHRRQVGPTLPPPLPEVAPSAPAGSACPQWYATALSAGWPASQWRNVDYVMHRESRCQPGVTSRAGAAGLMQLMPMWWHGLNPYNGWNNLFLAHRLWLDQGWRPWHT
jgi:Transglycosylase SLT domain